MEFTKDALRLQISVVSPIYGSDLDLHLLYSRLTESLSRITQDYEIILVNDRSPDNSWMITQELAEKDSRVKGVLLSKNFGQHKAISAGLHYVQGDWCVVMDCDLQDQPEEIIKLHKTAIEGDFDLVVGRRKNRQDPFLTRITSKLFYVFFNYLTENQNTHEVANFGIYSKKVVDSINLFTESDRSFGLLVGLVGYKKGEIDVTHAPRSKGKSSYSLLARINLALDLILSHSTKPLRLTAYMGICISAVAFILACFIVFRFFAFGTSVTGWTSLIVAISFFSGLITFALGIAGLYIGKIYEETKQRPLYLIDKTTFGN